MCLETAGAKPETTPHGPPNAESEPLGEDMTKQFLISRRTALKGLCAGAAAVSAAGLPRAGFAAESTLDRAKAAKSLVVGIANERPYGFVDTSGKLQGAIPDVLLAALKPHGIEKLEAQIADFNALIPGLNAGRFDVIGAGMYIRPARCEAIAFSNPITQTGGGLVVRKGSTLAAKGLADLAKDTSLKIGTQSGSSQVEELLKAGVPRDRLVLFARVDESVSGLQAKRCDVIYFPALQVNEILTTFKTGDLARVEGFETELNYQALGLRKADESLRAAINQGIAKMIADGTLLKIISSYGYGEREVPNTAVTAEKLCAG